jgi:hypothetical protein
MSGTAGSSLPYGRRQYDLLSIRRERAQSASRERTRNGRLALVGFALLGITLAVGLQTGWTPSGFGPPLATAHQAPGSFADTHTGSIMFSSFDGVLCKQMRFDNDSGRVTGGKLVRCDETEAAVAGPAEVPASGPQIRTQSLRDAFRK